MSDGRLRLKCDGTRADTRLSLSAKRTRSFKSAGGLQFSRLLAAEVCAPAVVMLDTPCSEVAWRVLATHSIRQFPLHLSSSASPCAITFHPEPMSFMFIFIAETISVQWKITVHIDSASTIFFTSQLEASWNVKAHAQKQDFVFRAKRTSPFKSARWGRQFSRLLAARGVLIQHRQIFLPRS